MIERQQFVQMSQQNIEAMNRETLVEIAAVKIDENLTSKEKMRSFLEQVKNPYCFLCGNTPVRVCFMDSAPSLEELLTKFFIHLKQG